AGEQNGICEVEGIAGRKRIKEKKKQIPRSGRNDKDKQFESGSGEPADPDARGGRFAKVNGFAGDEERHRFVVLAPFDRKSCTRTQAKAGQEFQKLAVLFVDTNNFRFVLGVKLGKRNNSLFAQLRDAAANGDAVWTSAVVAETLEEELLDFGRYS